MTENPKIFTDKLPPHDNEAEEAVVGSLLLDRDGEALGKASAKLAATDFYGARTHLIFEACLSLKDNRQVVDQVTLTHYLKSRDQLDTVGGGYISHLIATVPTPLHVEHYASIVKEMALKREQLQVALRLTEAAHNGAKPIEASEEAIQALEGIRSEGLVSLPVPLTFRNAMEMDVVEHESIVDGIVAKGKVNLWVGRPDQGKSIILQDLLTAHASGTPWLGQFDAGSGPAAHIDFEMAEAGWVLREKAQARHRDLEFADIPLYRFETLNNRLDSDAGATELLDLINKYNLSLVGLDPLSDCLGKANENDATPVREAFARLTNLCRATGVTLILCLVHACISKFCSPASRVFACFHA